MRLWTFQSKKAIDELLKKGELKVNWKHVNGDRWKKAYSWMVAQMGQKGIDCKGVAPIWAWHSCGKFGKGPTLFDARCLLSDIELEKGIKTVELECPEKNVLLSNYSAWNEILDRFLTEDKLLIKKDELNLLFEINPNNLNEFEYIQATIPLIKQEWLIEIRELKLKLGDSNCNELEYA